MKTLNRRARVLGLIVLAAASRLLPHLPNVTPVAAMALLGGAYLDSAAAAYALPLAALFLSDLVLGLHATMPFVYAGFLITVFLGTRLRANKTSGRVLASCLAGSLAFFALTNLGVWLCAGLYPKTPAGLLACYAAAVPFFRNSLLGDVFYTGVLFGLGAWLERASAPAAAAAEAR